MTEVQTRNAPAWEDFLTDPDLMPSYDMGPPSEPPDLTGKRAAECAELMIEWFRDNFEDPSESTPRDDGDWVYIWGGPYDAREELKDAFADQLGRFGSDTADTLIAAASHKLDGWEWAPSESRMQPETPTNKIVAAKQSLMSTFTAADDADVKGTFKLNDVALILHELYRLQQQIDSARNVLRG